MRRARLNYIIYFFLIQIISFVLSYYWSYLYQIGEMTEDSVLQRNALTVIVSVVANIYLAIGRLKDMNKNPVWAWTVLIPMVCIYFMFAKGSKGDNQYGMHPRKYKLLKEAENAEYYSIDKPANANINKILEGVSINKIPSKGKVEKVIFKLNSEYAHYYYTLSSEKDREYFQFRLEVRANKLKDDQHSYAQKFAPREFYIDDELIFSWRNEY